LTTRDVSIFIADVDLVDWVAQTLNISTFEYQLANAIGLLPFVFAPLFAGRLTDALGYRYERQDGNPINHLSL